MEKVAVLFPGQGAQHSGMGKLLYEEYAIARVTFEEAGDILGFDLYGMCTGGRLSELNRLENMLVAILTCSVASFRVYQSETGIKPMYMAGHSLGEYSALVCSGAVEFRDALRLVRLRSRLAQMVADKENGLLAVCNQINARIVDDTCKKISAGERPVAVACWNSPEQTVIAGCYEAVLDVQDALMEAGGQVTPLFMSAPFHSPVMREAASELRMELEACRYHPFQVPVIANVDARPYPSSRLIPEKLSAQMAKPVLWQQTMDFLEEQEVELAVEMGPQAITSILVNSYCKKVRAVSFGQKDDRQALLKLIRSGSGNGPDTNPISMVDKCLAHAIATRNRNENRDEFENGVIKPYEAIEQFLDMGAKNGLPLDKTDVIDALKLLKKIFDTKKVPENEQKERFEEIMENSGMNVLHEFFMLDPVDVERGQTCSN